MRRVTRWYGANPLHLLALLACFGLAGYAAAQLVPSRPAGVAVWFAGAVVGHDLVLMPLYSIADRSVLDGAGCGSSAVTARGLMRSRSASITADSRNSAPVTASQCHRNGSGDRLVEYW